MCAPPASPTFLLQAEYADRTPSSDESDWEFFVRHNWLPLLQLVHGSDWANQFGSEVPAMLALHTALVQAGAGAQRPQPPKPAPPVASPPARPQYLPESSFGMVSNRLPVDSYPSSPLSPHVEGDGSDDGSGGARAFTVEAVDIDGKRRRLRRKRAASPEEDAVSAALLPASRGKPLNGDIYLPGRQEAPPAAAPEAGRHDAVQSSVEAAATSAAAFKAVIDKLRQIKLDLSGEAEGSGADKAGGGEGEGEGSGAPAREDDSPTGVAAATGLEKGVLDMLTTVHGLSQRISFTTGLRDAPTQAPLPVAAAGSQAPTAADSDPQGALAKIKDLREKMNTLTRLLRCSFGDRTDVFGRTAMHVAAATGRADIVAALVGAGCDPNKTLPLDYRILERHGLARGKPPQQAVSAPEGVVAGDPAWKGGIERRPWPRKRARLSTGPPAPGPEIYSMQYSTPLHWAAARGDIACLEALLGTPSLDVNVPTLQGATALHIAAAGGRVAAVARLCRAPGINIDAVDMRKRTALHYAAAAGHVGVVEQLWARGACIDPADSASWRPLHYAVCSGFTEVASSLVIAGSQVQAYDTDVSQLTSLSCPR